MQGKRVGSARYAARHLDARRKGRQQRNASSAEDRALWKIVICGTIFVLIVAAKLLFPETVDSLLGSAAQMIGRDADFREAFAAMGRAASGEESVGDSFQDAYTAVFHPTPMSAAVTYCDGVPSEYPNENAAEMKSSSDTDDSIIADSSMKPDEDTEEQVEAVVSNSYVLPTFPENASLEQRNLGFSYTTPVQGIVSSSFGWREHPIAGDSRFHYGIDFAANTGTDIYAFADGEVFATGESSTLGKYIILSHANGYKTLYAHCSAVVKHSGSVSKGEIIAKVGESGVTTGPHLHFELQDGTLYLNPIFYVDLG